MEEGGPMNAITLNSFEDLQITLTKAFKSEEYMKGHQFQLGDTFKQISIHLKGEGYDSTINSNLMRGLLNLQNTIYRLYSIQVYGGIQKLTQAERKSLELTIKVYEGSSKLDVFLEKILEVFHKLTPKQIIATVSILTLGYVIGGIGTTFLDNQKEIDLMKIEVADDESNRKALIETFKLAFDAQKQFKSTLANEEFTTLDINGQNISLTDLHAQTVQTRTRKPVEEFLVSGDFKITRIDIEQDGTFIDVQNLTNGEKIPHINVFAEKLSEGEYQWMKDAVHEGTGKPVKMSIATVMRGGLITNALLVSFDYQTP